MKPTTVGGSTYTAFTVGETDYIRCFTYTNDDIYIFVEKIVFIYTAPISLQHFLILVLDKCSDVHIVI